MPSPFFSSGTHLGVAGRLTKRWRLLVLGIGGAAGALVGLGHLGNAAEHGLRELATELRQRDASGDLHVVEIDAHSIAAIDRWPWPRDNYARLIDRLREAGAASIVFDVDFSAHANAPDDAELAAALSRADGKVVLPTFGQYAGSGRRKWTDSLPIPALREHAVLAAVSVKPGADGYVRRALFGAMTEGLPRPSLSAMLAGVNGAADSDFPIDFTIDPQSIPRHSFIDIRDGRFDPRTIAGKKILIGATAIEMGDRYAVPNHGVIPGVVLQALAAETLAQGIPYEAGWPLPLVLALACAWPILLLRRRATLLAAIVVAPMVLFAASIAAQQMLGWIVDIVPALAAVTLVSAAVVTRRLGAAAHRRRSHDAQTGLPNRLGWRSHANEIGAGVVAARFAEFDKLSASLGETSTGDLVRRVHERLVLIADGAAIHRVEDRVLAWRCADAALLEDRLSTLRTMMLNPVEVAGRRIDVALALGFAARAERADDEATLAHALMAADHALAAGKAWHVHDPREEALAERELSLLGELDEAIGKGEIQVVYQPKLNLATDTIVSVEALVRWNHGTRGFLTPDTFIPLAERNDRIGSVTLHVIERTIADLAQWRACGHDITAAINLSAKLLDSRPFLVAIKGLVEQGVVTPAALTFEVTESAAMTDASAAAGALGFFKGLGIKISLDDYGTGQSTLSYLKQLPLDELKIDRSFVQFAHQVRSDGVLVQSTINLAHDLGLQVVAEGVEDVECLEFLRSLGCDLVQGYLVGKPMAAGDLQALLGRKMMEAA